MSPGACNPYHDRWVQLYWKAQLEGIKAEREKWLEALERENMKTIEAVYGALVGDSEVQAQVEKIKAHVWMVEINYLVV